MNKIFILLLVLTSGFTTFAAPKSEDLKDAKVVEANFPKELAAMKEDNSGTPLTIQNGLGYAFERVEFGGKDKTQYLVIIYQAAKSPSNIACKLVVIKLGAKANVVMPDAVLNDKDELGNCSSIEIKDLDGDSNPEILVQGSNSRGHSLPPYIFSWNGEKLADITPTTVIDGDNISVFRNISISDAKIGKSNLIIDQPFESHDEDGMAKTYLVENEKVILSGTFDFFTILESRSKKKLASTVLNPSFAQAGTYTLDIKNLSAHNRAVRAEVTVNGVVVLKPKDFCAAPPNKNNRDNQNDDDDDKDEDHCKRCVPKNDAYAIVNLKVQNEIKVKVYGRGDSKLQFSLTQK